MNDSKVIFYEDRRKDKDIEIEYLRKENERLRLELKIARMIKKEVKDVDNI